MTVIVENGVIRLNGVVGASIEWAYEDSFSPSDVVLALASVDPSDELTVHINSPGGIASDGAAIHSMLVARPGTTRVIVEGIAASAGSLIAMAGDPVVMTAGSTMMIHDPSGFTFGTSDDHSKTIDGLEALATSYARVYASKSGKTEAECRALMKATTWLTPAKAVAAGFADETTEKKADPVAAFDYRAYAHPPKRLAAMAEANGWKLPASDSPKPSPKPKETKMSERNLAEARQQVSTRFTAILKSDEAKDFIALAEHLAYETDLSPEAAVAIMSKAAEARQVQDDAAFMLDYEARRGNGAERLNGAGLNVALTGSRPAPRVDLVAQMKQRHGVK